MIYVKEQPPSHLVQLANDWLPGERLEASPCPQETIKTNKMSEDNNMKFLLFAFLLLGLAPGLMTTDAAAQEGKYYISGYAGSSFGNTLTIPPGDVVIAIFPPPPSIDIDQGFYGNLALGMRFRNFRIEAEVGLVNLDFVDPATPTTTGNGELLSFMANGYVDFKPSFGIRPYVGLGAGLASVDLGLLSSEEFAWQVMTGADLPLGERVSFGVQYRYFVSNTPGAGMEDLKSHIFMVGLKFFFK